MKLLRLKHLSLAVLLMTGAAFTACSSSEDDIIGQSVNPTESEVFTMTIQATKGEEATTRALSLEGNILSATWAEGEEVTVYNETKKEELTGTLKAQSAGASTTLKGELSGTKGIDANDKLTLKFLSPNYDTQEGTLDYIAENCDYATASVTVTSVSDGNIVAGPANFENQQAILRLELSKPNGYEGLYTQSMRLVVDKQVITVNLSEANKDVYVAVPQIANRKFVIGASSDGSNYYYIKSMVSFAKSKYYSIAVKMKPGIVVFDEAELNSAISANASYVVLGCNITPKNCILIEGSKNITLDLCSNLLNRELKGPPSGDGHVIGIRTGCSLTITDTSSDNLGRICGGWAANGGGIYINSGATVTLNGGYVSHNYAENKGGGIYNAGTLNIGNMDRGVWIENNNCKGEGGGIYNAGTLNIKGFVQVKSNANTTAGSMDSNLCLASGKKINVTGEMGSSCDIRVYCENYQEQVITSGYHDATNRISVQGFLSDVGGFRLWYEDKEILFQQTSYGTAIRYIDRNWDESAGKVVETMRLAFAQNLFYAGGGGDGQIDLNGYYYVTGNVTTKDKLYAAGEVHLILCDGASLTANSLVCDEYPVHIYGQTAGTGQFIATDPDSGYPGIGCHKKDGKTVYIAGGVITVKGASNCAGIGGGYYQDSSTTTSHQYCSSIYIYGGTINATGGSEAAGIGGSGNSYWFGDIYIYGGSVTAQGGSSPAFNTDGGGAGIGGGDLCPNGGDIYVKGGTVNATGGDEAAGIGIGQNEKNIPLNTHIYISGGTVTATGGARGAGIGGGDGVSGCFVKVYGGTVYAYGGTDAAGIGSGEGADNNDGGSFEITGGFVEATGSGNGSGLGAGEDAALGNITISGGTVIAHGSSDGKAICSHNDSGTNNVSIGKTMRLRISDNILPYTAREISTLKNYDDIQIEPCTHKGNPCAWCMKGR